MVWPHLRDPVRDHDLLKHQPSASSLSLSLSLSSNSFSVNYKLHGGQTEQNKSVCTLE